VATGSALLCLASQFNAMQAILLGAGFVSRMIGGSVVDLHISAGGGGGRRRGGGGVRTSRTR
jgi:hypothetical protein